MARVPLFLVVVGAISVQPALAAPRLPGAPLAVADVAVENPPIFPLSEVRRGLEGIGYTVFESASGPEAFGFVVLGVMRNYLGPGEDLIIAKLTGERIERTGVISGMSGSPVYIDGRLVGAVGYRFGSFTEDPIAGITPIERMLAVAKPLPDPGMTAERAPEDPGVSPALASRPSPAVGPVRRSMASTQWGVAEPIAVPIATAGMSPAVAEAFADKLKERGYGPMVPAAGSGGGASAAAGALPDKLFASGPVAGVLVSGDLLMAGIGTVTWVNDTRFLAFGHPFLGIGSTEMPVFNAEIVTTVASKAGSWKMGQATTPVGRLTDDRLHAIGGTLGADPHTMPVKVHLDMPGPRAAHNARDTLSFRVLRHPTDTPLFTAIALANALTSRIGVERSGTLYVEGRARLSTGDEVKFARRTASDGGALEVNAALAVLAELEAMVDNGVRDLELSEVEVSVRRHPDVALARVSGLKPLAPLHAGGAAKLLVELHPWEGEREERVIDVRLPRGLRAGTYQLVAASPKEARRLEEEGGVLAQPVSFEAWLAARRRTPLDGELSLYLVSETPGLTLDGEGLPALPASLTGVLGEGGGAKGALLEQRVVRLSRLDVGGVLSGMAKARVHVEEEDSPYSLEARR